MKNILVLLLITVFSFTSVFAYTAEDLKNKTSSYKKELIKKVSIKIEKLSEKKLKKILVLIDKYILKYKNNKKFSDSKKLDKISILLALKEIINEKIEDEFGDIDFILNEVNKKNEIIIISDKGFKVLDKKIIDTIKKESYIKGNKNSEILWLEYSDIECPFCAKLHNSGTKEELNKKYGNKLSYSLQHFPLGFHKNALNGAKALECTAYQKGEKSYFELENIIFKNKISDLDFIIKESVKLGTDKDKLLMCIGSNGFTNKINSQKNQGIELFGITGTPGNVLINTKTGEYKLINGAYPTIEFTKVIDKLLK